MCVCVFVCIDYIHRDVCAHVHVYVRVCMYVCMYVMILFNSSSYWTGCAIPIPNNHTVRLKTDV